MSFDAAQVIASLGADMQGTLTAASGETATVGRASIASELLAMTYGEDDQYTLSVWLDTDDFDTPPTKNQDVTFGGSTYLVLGIANLLSTLRRLDLGGQYGR